MNATKLEQANNKKKIIYSCLSQNTMYRSFFNQSFLEKRYKVSKIISKKKSYGRQLLSIAASIFYRVVTFRFFAVHFFFLGYLEQFFVPFFRCISRKPIIFDIYVSLFVMVCIDRKIKKPDSIIGKLLYWIEKKSLQKSDLIIIDTQAHKDRFMQLYGNHKKINADKFKVLYIGSDEESFYPIIDCKKSDGFTVTFSGTYIPLHGIHNILRAAKIIAEKNSDIRFTMIGEGQTFKENYRLYQDLGNTNVDFVPEFISREKLNIYYNQADLLLGIFGESYKACEVIPNKVYDALAVGRPILSMDSAAMRELFVDQETVFLVEGNSPEKIAEYILMLYKEDKLLHQVAKNGHLFFKQRFSREVLELQLEKYIAQVGL